MKEEDQPKLSKPSTPEQIKSVMPNMYRQTLRSPLSFFCQIIVPIIMIFVGCLIKYLLSFLFYVVVLL